MPYKKNRYYYSLKKFSISARSTIDGRWKLVRRLGIGGNGEVWQCRGIRGHGEWFKGNTGSGVNYGSWFMVHG